MASVRIGWVQPGDTYEVTATAAQDNQGSTFVTIGWEPAPGHQPQTYPLRLAPGQKGHHALVCPSSGAYYVISIDVDVPEPGKTELAVQVNDKNGKPVSTFEESVDKDGEYWLEIKGW